MNESLRLAAVFARIITEVYTPNELAEVNSRNDADGMSRDVCHTHDFYDSNDLMLQAFNETFLRDPDLSNSADVDQINKAWIMAKKCHFNVVSRVYKPELSEELKRLYSVAATVDKKNAHLVIQQIRFISAEITERRLQAVLDDRYTKPQ